MVYEQNKNDFEKRLSDLETIYLDLEEEIPSPLFSAIEDLMSEYNGHFKDDIEQLATDLESANDKLDELNSILRN